MKKYLFIATALVALASCSDDTFVGENSPNEANGNGAISFGFNVPNITRGTDADARKLSNQFIVWGEKNESSTNVVVAAGEDGTGDNESIKRAGHLVFKNYIVNWVNNPNSTTSNSHGWEYVGFKFDDESATIPTTSYTTNVTPNTKPTEGDAPAQTIKYWDMAAGTYTFTAVSALPADINGGKVKITKTTSDASSVYNKGYSVVVTDEADLAHLYFSDRVNMVPGTNPVTLTFRNSISQVRVGMYETVPGYDVKVTKFYYATEHATSTPAFSDMTSENTTNFVADLPNVSPASGKTSVAGTFTVKYYEQSTANDDAGITNHPTVSFATATTDSKITLSLGAGVYNTKLEESSATPTYDKTSGAFTTVFPQENNSTNLKLKIDYQLFNTTTGETINLTAKTAEVPAQYLKWKPNYKYTYIFKITDDALTPITFDAVQIEAEDGNVEYITTVSEPSITTYAKASAVTTDNEYLTGNTIYTVVEDGSTNPALTVNSNAKLYIATIEDGAAQEITEKSVANAIAENTDGYGIGVVLASGTDLTGYYTYNAGTYTSASGTADGTTTYYPSATYSVKDANGKKLVINAAEGLTAVDAITASESPTGETLSINGAKFTPAAPTFTQQEVTEGTTVVTGWYTLDSSSGSDVYTLITTADTKAAANTNYYKKTATTAGYYVFEYIARDKATGTYVSGETYYSEAVGGSAVDTTSFEAGVTDVSSYYVGNPKKYYKVIKVVDKY